MENNNEIDQGAWVEDCVASLAPPEGWEANVPRGLARFQRGRQIRKAWGKSFGWAGVAAVAAAASLLAFPSTRVFARRCVDACLFRSEPAGAGQDLTSVHREFAPDFVLPDASGKSVHLSELRGQVVLLNFWATWCGPCTVEIPWFVELQQRYRDAGLTVLGISMDDNGWDSVRPYLNEHAVNYRVVTGNDDLAESYGGVDALPTTFLIDRQGRIASVHQGLFAVQAWEAEIQTLLGQPSNGLSRR